MKLAEYRGAKFKQDKEGYWDPWSIGNCKVAFAALNDLIASLGYQDVGLYLEDLPRLKKKIFDRWSKR